MRANNLFRILCLIWLKGQQFYGGSHKNPFQFYFSKKKKKEQQKFFFKLCLSLKGHATIWEGAESFQNFLPTFLLKNYISIIYFYYFIILFFHGFV